MRQYPLEILIKVNANKVIALKENLAKTKQKALAIEKKVFDLKKKENELFSLICSKRVSGDLSLASHFDEYLIFLKKEIVEWENRKKKTLEETLAKQKEIFSHLQQKKKFEKLKKRWLQKHLHHETEF